jgi:hypothetical protein
MSIVGWFVGDEARELATMFELGSTGLSYRIIFSVVLISIVNSFLALLIARVFNKLMFLWQLITTMFVCLAANSIVVATFRWIPTDSWQAWLWFAGSFVAMFTIISTVMIIQTKRADKQYEKQLSDYKAKQRKEENA